MGGGELGRVGCLRVHMQREYSPVDRIIGALAALQYGVVARWQLELRGIGAGAIHHRLRQGRLHLLHEGVYAVGHPVVARSGRWMAAALAFGPGAVLSHLPAAQVWGLLKPTNIRPHVTSAARSLVGRPGIVLHRVRSLAPELTTEVDGLPVTTVPRVLLDLAGYRDLRPLRRAWEGAQRQHLLDVDKVVWICANSPGRRTKPLKALIAEATDAPDTLSEFEDRFTDFLRERPDIPTPHRNVLIHDYMVDVHWPGTNVIVELDSKGWHWHRREEDSERDADLAIQGYVVYRITWRALTKHPERTAEKLRRLLRTASSPTRAAREAVA